MLINNTTTKIVSQYLSQTDTKCDILILSVFSNSTAYWVCKKYPDIPSTIMFLINKHLARTYMLNPLTCNNMGNPLSNYLNKIIAENEHFATFQPEWILYVKTFNNPIFLQLFKGETIQ